MSQTDLGITKDSVVIPRSECLGGKKTKKRENRDGTEEVVLDGGVVLLSTIVSLSTGSWYVHAVTLSRRSTTLRQHAFLDVSGVSGRVDATRRKQFRLPVMVVHRVAGDKTILNVEQSTVRITSKKTN